MRLKVPESRGPSYIMDPVKTFCGTFPPKTPSVTYEAGKPFDVEIEGYSPHGGGGCAFSLSYDNGKTFTVIKVTDTNCPITKKYSVTIPSNAPSCDHCIFAWSWVPVESGWPQHYMGCADIIIKGTQSGTSLKGVSLPIVNLPDMKNSLPDWHHNNKQGNTLPWVNEKSFFGALAGGGSANGESDTSTDTSNEPVNRRKCQSKY